MRKYLNCLLVLLIIVCTLPFSSCSKNAGNEEEASEKDIENILGVWHCIVSKSTNYSGITEVNELQNTLVIFTKKEDGLYCLTDYIGQGPSLIKGSDLYLSYGKNNYQIVNFTLTNDKMTWDGVIAGEQHHCEFEKVGDDPAELVGRWSCKKVEGLDPFELNSEYVKYNSIELHLDCTYRFLKYDVMFYTLWYKKGDRIFLHVNRDDLKVEVYGMKLSFKDGYMIWDGKGADNMPFHYEFEPIAM